MIGLIAAAALWFMPYDWKSNPDARFKVEAAQLARDHSYFWLDLHLVKSGEEDHSKDKPVWLETSGGEKLEAAAVTFGSRNDEGVTEIWYKFWVPEKDFAGPISLHLNDADLTIRSHSGVPSIEEGQTKVFRTKYW